MNLGQFICEGFIPFVVGIIWMGVYPEVFPEKFIMFLETTWTCVQDLFFKVVILGKN